jgi:hypothetical protein
MVLHSPDIFHKSPHSQEAPVRRERNGINFSFIRTDLPKNLSFFNEPVSLNPPHANGLVSTSAKHPLSGGMNHYVSYHAIVPARV